MEQKIDSPDPRVHGAQIIFDSRFDQFSSIGKEDEEEMEKLPKVRVVQEEAAPAEEPKSGFKFKPESESHAAETIDESRQASVNFMASGIEKGVNPGYLRYLISLVPREKRTADYFAYLAKTLRQPEVAQSPTAILETYLSDSQTWETLNDDKIDIESVLR